MQFKNVAQLKKFILWAKSQQILHFKAGEIEVIFNGTAFIEPYTDISNAKPDAKSQKTLLDDLQATNTAEENDLLFWSTKG